MMLLFLKIICFVDVFGLVLLNLSCLVMYNFIIVWIG